MVGDLEKHRKPDWKTQETRSLGKDEKPEERKQRNKRIKNKIRKKSLQILLNPAMHGTIIDMEWGLLMLLSINIEVRVMLNCYLG
jgi:hypothetical protein